jgi:hypothetical protein
VTERLADLRYWLYAPVPVIVWFFLVSARSPFGWPFNFIGFLALVAVYLWVLWGAPS